MQIKNIKLDTSKEIFCDKITCLKNVNKICFEKPPVIGNGELIPNNEKCSLYQTIENG